MKFTVEENFDVSVYLVAENQELNMVSSEVAEYLSSTLDYKGKKKAVYSSLGPKSENLILVGLGDEKELTRDIFVEAAHTAAKELNSKNVSQANVDIKAYGEVDSDLAVQAVVEGFLQADYTFDTYKEEKTENSLVEINVVADSSNTEAVIQEAVNLLSGVNFTRNLTNTPANDLYPETLAEKVTEKFADTDVKVEIYDKAQLEEMGMKALLAVSKGSPKEPRLIVLKYLPLGQDKPAVSLVGKGVTYDSGGYALKSAKGMASMKVDMAGAASMIGTLYALAKNKVQKNAVAVIAATENMVSGDAFKNGDIIGSLKGSTIEVLNTDAEGRLILADALYYAATEINSSGIVDAATLTGAVIAALGKNITGTLTNNQALLDTFLTESKVTGEDMWQLPLNDEFRDQTKGNITDLVNISKNPTGAGSVFAAAFLEHFVEDVPWIHLDIAGTASSSKGNKYLPDGASGVPVKTLYAFVKNN